jgi:hypothetical protein
MHPIYEHWLVPMLGTIAGLAGALFGWLKIADWWTEHRKRRKKK